MQVSIKGQRMTKQRRLVLEELRKLKTHPSAEELHAIAQRNMPNISLGTVYRNLDLLWRNGQILKLEMAGAQARYDGDTRPHYHARCRVCGHITDLFTSQVAGIDHPRVMDSNFRVTGWRIEFEGVCPSCDHPRNVEMQRTEEFVD
ncbi:MAG: transcriptional repressor [Candidatus Hydrogenedens sp.]|nr:transcriptional repressor [Candidatus Hydrogenedentota bacterium]NLF58854.1 transcriptional repressor [Candidatus Hydrogenedens sp.]